MKVWKIIGAFEWFWIFFFSFLIRSYFTTLLENYKRLPFPSELVKDYMTLSNQHHSLVCSVRKFDGGFPVRQSVSQSPQPLFKLQSSNLEFCTTLTYMGRPQRPWKHPKRWQVSFIKSIFGQFYIAPLIYYLDPRIFFIPILPLNRQNLIKFKPCSYLMEPYFICKLSFVTQFFFLSYFLC